MDWLDTLIRELQAQSPPGVRVTRTGETLALIQDDTTWVEAGNHADAIIDQWEIFNAMAFHRPVPGESNAADLPDPSK